MTNFCHITPYTRVEGGFMTKISRKKNLSAPLVNATFVLQNNHLMKIAIYGTGSLGSVIGAGLINGGVDIDLVDTDKEQIEAIRKNGLHIIGGIDITVKGNALYPEEMTPGYDIILLATKVMENEKVVPFLATMLKDDGVIVTLQNSLPEGYISEVVGTRRTMGCTVEWGATLVSPGVCELTSHPDYLSVHVGKMPGVTSGRAMEVRNLLNKACRVHYENNLLGARWAKLIVNCSLSAVNAINGGTFGDIAKASKKVRGVCVDAMNECIKVGKAAGAKFTSNPDVDMARDFVYKNRLQRALAIRRLPGKLKHHVNIKAAMLVDLEKGKPCEVDELSGLIVEYGKRYGIETPVNSKIVETIHKIQKGELKIDANNIGLLF